MTAGAMAMLHDEHRELLPSIEALGAVADEVGRTAGPALRAKLAETYDFLAHQLLPHAMAEDEVLYPEVARLMGADGATATMSRDHVAVASLITELASLRTFEGDPDPGRQNALRRVLYGLHALVGTHFAKEEEIYVPLLDARLTVAEGTALMQRMEAAAARVKARAG